MNKDRLGLDLLLDGDRARADLLGLAMLAGHSMGAVLAWVGERATLSVTTNIGAHQVFQGSPSSSSSSSSSSRFRFLAAT